MKTVYTVADRSSGEVMAIFASHDDAKRFVKAAGRKLFWIVIERVIHWGQPENPGYNK